MPTPVERIFSLLKVKKIEQKEFAQLLGTTDKTVSAWKTGRSQSYTKYLSKIADVLDTTVEYLVSGGEKKPAPISEGEQEITFDDFTYAMENEAKDLTEMDKQILLSMARQLNDARKKRDGESG